jgi:hypothetical protein
MSTLFALEFQISIFARQSQSEAGNQDRLQDHDSQVPQPSQYNDKT